MPSLCLVSHLASPRRHLATQQMNLKLRPYQQDCISNCLEALEENKRRIAVSLPTGGGKTVIFSSLIDKVQPRNEHGQKTLILVHRKELAFQAATTCKRMNPQMNVQVEMGDHWADPDTADVVVASVQTLIRGRLNKFDPKDFKLLIVDEAHHAAADSYIHVFDYFNITPTSDVALVGFSATIRREDKKSLDSVFDEIVFHLDLDKMILNKHLSDAKFTTVKLENADMSKVKSKNGEFVMRSLSAVMNTPTNNELVLHTFRHFQENHKIKSTLLFGINIEHVTDLCALFNANGIHAESVTSKSKKLDRDRIVKNFKDGKIPVLMNCGIFTEGTDMPNIDCLLLVRPTKSQTLLIQMIGRGLRLHDSKDFCHIIDFVGVNGVDVVSTPTLRGLPSSLGLDGLTLEEMEDRKKRLDVELRDKEEKERAKQKAEKKMAETRAMAVKQRLREGLKDPNVETEINLDTFKSIELSTFENFAAFVRHMEVNEEALKRYKSIDRFFIKSAVHAWVNGIPENVWVLPVPKKHRAAHLRLQIHPDGISKDFWKDVDASHIYTSKKPALNIKSKLYTLSLYEERAQFKDKWNYPFNRYQKRYSASLVMEVTDDIRKALSFAKRVMDLSEASAYVDLTKFAKWRKTPSTPKQIEFAWSSIQAVMKGEEQKNRDLVKGILENMNKGEMSDFLTAHNIFRTEVLKRFVRGCIKRARKMKTSNQSMFVQQGQPAQTTELEQQCDESNTTEQLETR